jgi:hypothetical protein
MRSRSAQGYFGGINQRGERLNQLNFDMLEAFERLHLTSSDFYTQLNTSDLPQRLREPLQIQRLDSFAISNFKSFSKMRATQGGRFTWGRCWR